jgi:hypothetical protein
MREFLDRPLFCGSALIVGLVLFIILDGHRLIPFLKRRVFTRKDVSC